MKTYSGMYINRSFNTDILEKALQSDLLPRRSGKTFAKIMLLVGEVTLCDPANRYLFICETNHHCNQIRDEFQRILHHDGFATTLSTLSSVKIDARPSLHLFGKIMGKQDYVNIKVDFVAPAWEFRRRFVGLNYDRIFVDLTPMTYNTYSKDIEYLQARCTSHEY